MTRRQGVGTHLQRTWTRLDGFQLDNAELASFRYRKKIPMVCAFLAFCPFKPILLHPDSDISLVTGEIMLQLKSNLPQAAPAPAYSLSELPQEVLDIILEFLYLEGGGRVFSIDPASRTCRSFRSAALPRLFESVSCVIRQHRFHRPHPSFPKLVDHPHLLKHVKVLTLQHPLVRVEAVLDNQIDSSDYNDEPARCHDIGVLERALLRMSQLQKIR